MDGYGNDGYNNAKARRGGGLLKVRLGMQEALSSAGAPRLWPEAPLIFLQTRSSCAVLKSVLKFRRRPAQNVRS